MQDDAIVRPPLGWWIGIIGGLGLNALVGFSDAAYAAWCAHVTPALSQGLIRAIFLGGIAAHVGEAFYAWRIATQADLRSASAWTLQTLLLGFPSLSRLRQQVARR